MGSFKSFSVVGSKRGTLQMQRREVGVAAGGEEELLDADLTLAGADQKATVAAADLGLVAEEQRKFALKDVDGGAVDGRVGDSGDALAVVEPGHLDAESVQGLADLQPDWTQADDGDRFR
jgi:hypothetical protein